MQNRLALESLTQRGKTPLYNDLVSLYQSTQDALRDSPRASAADINLGLKHIDFDKRLKDLVKKYMGIALNKVVITESVYVNMFSSIYVTKNYLTTLKKRTKTPGMMMEEIQRLYDDKTGYLDNPDDQRFSFVFSLDIFTSWWSLKDDDGSYFFTAEEVAAVTLHELGHTDHFIRTFARVYTRTLDASDILNYVNAEHDRAAVLELLSQLRKSKYLQKNWGAVLDTTETYFKTNNALDDPYYWEALSALSALLAADIASHNLSDYDFATNFNNRVKTKSGSLDAERSADEFSARNGAYAPLVSALSKMDRIHSKDSHLHYKQFLFTPAALFFGSLNNFVSLFSISSENIVQGYDPLIRRMSLIVETAKHAFHDENLPDEMKRQLKDQIEQSENYIKQYEDSSHHKVRAKLNAWKDSIAKFGRVVVFPLRSNMRKDYDKLQNANRSLTRHPLYYLADK